MWRRPNPTMKLLLVVTLLWREALCGSPSVQIGRMLFCVNAPPCSSFPSLFINISVKMMKASLPRPHIHRSPCLPPAGPPPLSPSLSLSSLYRSHQRRPSEGCCNVLIMSTFPSFMYMCMCLYASCYLRTCARLFVLKVLTGEQVHPKSFKSSTETYFLSPIPCWSMNEMQAYTVQRP